MQLRLDGGGIIHLKGVSDNEWEWDTSGRKLRCSFIRQTCGEADLQKPGHAFVFEYVDVTASHIEAF